MKTLYHATTHANVPDILDQGLLIRKSTSKTPAIWLHTKRHTPWAILHTQRRHDATLAQVVILEVNVSHAMWRTLRRFANGVVKHGIWMSLQDIPPSRLRVVGDGTVFAGTLSD